jgi:nucleoid-associated protein YejK
MAKKEMFTDLLAAVAESLKTGTSHLSLEADVNQSGAVKILQKHRRHHYTTQVYKYHNEDNQFGESNCTHKIQI